MEGVTFPLRCDAVVVPTPSQLFLYVCGRPVDCRTNIFNHCDLTVLSLIPCLRSQADVNLKELTHLLILRTIWHIPITKLTRRLNIRSLEAQSLYSRNTFKLRKHESQRSTSLCRTNKQNGSSLTKERRVMSERHDTLHHSRPTTQIKIRYERCRVLYTYNSLALEIWLELLVKKCPKLSSLAKL